MEIFLSYFGMILGLSNWGYWWFYMSSKLLEKKVNKKSAVICGLVTGAAQTLLIIAAMMGLAAGSLLQEFIVFMFLTVLYIIVFWKKGKHNLLNVSSAVLFGLFLLYNYLIVFSGLTLTFTSWMYMNPYLNFLVVLFRAVFVGLFGWLMPRVFEKFKFRELLKQLCSVRWKGIICVAVCFLLRISYYIFWYATLGLNTDTQELMQDISSVLFCFIFTVITLGTILFAAVWESNQTKLKAQEAIILQQQNYVYSLENMQKQMRAFRHDLQNMMSGLYLQSSEGDIAGVQEFLKRSINYFDEHLGKEIKQMGFLSNIKNMELKSMLLVKLMQAQKMELECNIEVISPVEELGMEAEDFLRCLGILVDNAFEAVHKSLKKKVNIVLFSDKNQLNVVVENPVVEKPLLRKISEKGYSTKGEGRGLGLHNYQEILKRYYNAVPNTVCNEELFRQELRIRRR